MNPFKFAELEQEQSAVALQNYQLGGWVQTHRQSKNVSFIELSDGSSVKGLQLIIKPDLKSYLAIADQITTGCSLEVSGSLVESPARGQSYELYVSDIVLVGPADAQDYPLQKKGHTLDFLRENLHLRPRSKTIAAVLRVRSRLNWLVHDFFVGQGFYLIHTPIITAADCEGAGEMFKVSNLDFEAISKTAAGAVDYSKDFFNRPSYLTVSGQLEAEIFATALSKVYTFGPTFRAENSNTSRHLSEFWMIEPEMAFCDLLQNAGVAEAFLKHLISGALEHCAADLDFLHKRDWADKKLRTNLESVVAAKAEIIAYDQVISILENASAKFEFPVSWGMDLQAEHERYLAEKHVGAPVFIINYPKEIKPFYMRENPDQRTVAAMDLIVPGIGEIIGGSQREERLDVLSAKMAEHNLDPLTYQWYLDLRAYGTVPHSGFGLGFERVLMYITGMKNIRDVTAVPRYPGHASP